MAFWLLIKFSVLVGASSYTLSTEFTASLSLCVVENQIGDY